MLLLHRTPPLGSAPFLFPIFPESMSLILPVCDVMSPLLVFGDSFKEEEVFELGLNVCKSVTFTHDVMLKQHMSFHVWECTLRGEEPCL